MLWGFDIECEGWDQLIVGVAYNGRDTIILRSDDDCAKWYKRLDTTDLVISHNGGAYDFLYLISVTPDLHWQATVAGSSIITCRTKGGATCRDTYRLFAQSLAKWCNLDKDTGVPCICGKSCGGYCGFKRNASRSVLRNITEYCVRDTQAMWHQYVEDCDRLKADGLAIYTPSGRPRGTIGGVAWHTAAAMANLDTRAEIEPDDYDAGRAGYYGGRTEVGRTRAPSGHRYDVHSMYPWALTHSVPTGQRLALDETDALRALNRDMAGLYEVTVDLPDTDVPLLPHRYYGPTKGRLTPGRLLWSTGQIRGTYALPELQAAIGHGAKVVDVHGADIWQAMTPLFEPYVTHIYGKRREAIDAGDDRWGKILKWFANSLCGKLAQRPEMSTIKVLGVDDNPPAREDGKGEWNWLGGRVYAQTTRKIPSCAHSWIAAYLTAHSRVLLLDRLVRHSGRWLYCDTDSTYLIDKDPIGVHPSDLGAWGYDGECNEWLALAPKLYRYKDAAGDRFVRARGIPKPTWDTLDELAAGETIRRESGVKLIRQNRGLFERRSVQRTHKDATTGRCGTRFVNNDGTTRPLRRSPAGVYI